MTTLQMNYQPKVLDAPIPTVWDLVVCNLNMQKGIVTGGIMTFNCYASAADIGVKNVIESRSYSFTADQAAAFQQGANLQPEQMASWGYAFAQALDTFFAGATLG